VRVSVVYFDGCPSWQETGSRVQAALAQLGVDTAVEYVPVTTGEEAVGAGFAGSPTILVDGHDLFPGPGSDQGLGCRLYRTPAGLAGMPDLADVVGALKGRVRS
jgi:hypothetical protein